MNKVNIIASIVEGETLCDFGLLMEDTEFKDLLKEQFENKKIANISIDFFILSLHKMKIQI